MNLPPLLYCEERPPSRPVVPASRPLLILGGRLWFTDEANWATTEMYEGPG